jgi:hypothetical protein
MGNPWAYDFSAIGRPPAPLLVIIGGDGEAVASRRGGFHVGGNSDVYRLIPETVPFEQLNMSKQFLKQPGRPDPANFACVLNLVTDPDQHPRTLERLAKLLRGYRGRVINRPEAVLRSTRYQVAKRLAGTPGLRVPRVLRLRNPKPNAAAAAIAKAGLSFPLIVRKAGTHTGDIIGLVEDDERLDSACAGGGEFVITEFVDFASPDGLYRKYRLWAFGRRTILKQMIISDQWNIHNHDRNRIMAGDDKLIAEEKRMMRRSEGDFAPAVHAMFDAVRERMGLDVFGMDFGILPSGEAVLFEANATMSFKMTADDPRFAYLDEAVIPSREAFAAMLFPS